MDAPRFRHTRHERRPPPPRPARRAETAPRFTVVNRSFVVFLAIPFFSPKSLSSNPARGLRRTHSLEPSQRERLSSDDALQSLARAPIARSKRSCHPTRETSRHTDRRPRRASARLRHVESCVGRTEPPPTHRRKQRRTVSGLKTE